LGVDRILQSVNAGLTMSGWTERPQSSFIVPPIIQQVIGPRLDFDLNLMQATKYVSGRIVLVGDAAHTVHPMAGKKL
jgi:2-polyprenyl-6-methoxyphenol hydroxylase-like FAD-dependent oxidoreductase